jgi:hypothetical protein
MAVNEGPQIKKRLVAGNASKHQINRPIDGGRKTASENKYR